MNGTKQKTPQSEKDQALLAKRMTDVGMGLQGKYVEGQMAANRYDPRGRNAARNSADLAKSITAAAKRSGGKNRVKQARDTGVVGVGGDIALMRERNSNGVKVVQNVSRGAWGAAKAGANALSTIGISARIDNMKERTRFSEAIDKRNAIFDAAGAAAVYGLEKKWEADKKAEEEAKKKAIDNAVNRDPFSIIA